MSAAELSRRSFIERIVNTGVTTPAMISLSGAWLATESTAFADGRKKSSSSQSGSSAGSVTASHASNSTTQSSGSSAAGSSESSDLPPGGILYTDADSTLRGDSPNSNEGANPRIRVSVAPARRGIVHFNDGVVDVMAAEVAGGANVYLHLFIAENGNNWTQSEDHAVDVHPLPPGFSIPEGDGMMTGLPSGLASRGSGYGVTWASAADPNITDSKRNARKSDPLHWEGGSRVMGDATAPGQVHVNQQAGRVTWDVTEDVRQGTNAWVVKVRDERCDDDDRDRDHGVRRAGDDPFHGAVDYYSREGAAALDYNLTPQLQLVYGGSGSSSSAEGSSAQLPQSTGGHD